MGKTEYLEKGMAVVEEKMRPVIGEDLYANQVSGVFAALPNLEAFDSAVDIIDDVDSTARAVGDHDNCWRKTKRCLPSNEDDYAYADRSIKQKTTRSNKQKMTRSTGDIADDKLGSLAACHGAHAVDGVSSSESDDAEDDEEEAAPDDNVDDDDHLYVTYEDVTDDNGNVVGVRAYDSRYPDDAEPHQRIGGWVRKDKDGNVIERTYDDYVKKTTTKE